MDCPRALTDRPIGTLELRARSPGAQPLHVFEQVMVRATDGFQNDKTRTKKSCDEPSSLGKSAPVRAITCEHEYQVYI